MKKSYLGVWETPDGQSHLEITVTPSDVVQRQHGRVSALFPSDGSDRTPRLGNSGAVLFLVSNSPTKMLAALTNDVLREEGSASLFISHGHASAIVLTITPEEAVEIVEETKSLAPITSYEVWPYSGDAILVDQIVTVEPAPALEWPTLHAISDARLDFESRAQVEQFNLNVALLSRIASSYAPELESLTTWLHGSVADIVAQLGELADLDDGESQMKSLQLEVVLVEANAVLTLYTSQMGSGTLPLLSGTFPVGEYSLLGIGGMSRAAWRIYIHLNSTFAAHNHVGLLRMHYPHANGFDAFAPVQRTDYSAWRGSKSNLEDFDDVEPGEFRFHIPYFSSRWGFHEALHSISLSWQCLYASASKEWNMLTATHEFLHAHVRDLFSFILRPNDPTLAQEIVDAYNRRDSGKHVIDSMRMAYVEALIGIRNTARIAARVGPKQDKLEASAPASIDVKYLDQLNREHSELVQEIVVHVLDFRYVYDSRDDVYINSIWSSWSLVPSVGTRIDHYLLRTMCALAATSREDDPRELFKQVSARLLENLKLLQGRPRSRPTITNAIRLLEDDLSMRRLGIQFMAAAYVVELTKNFFLDSRLNAALVRDDLTRVLDGRRTYDLEKGKFLGETIASPIGFLLDRFAGYADQAGSDGVEYESIWQMLQLI